MFILLWEIKLINNVADLLSHCEDTENKKTHHKNFPLFKVKWMTMHYLEHNNIHHIFIIISTAIVKVKILFKYVCIPKKKNVINN